MKDISIVVSVFVFHEFATIDKDFGVRTRCFKFQIPIRLLFLVYSVGSILFARFPRLRSWPVAPIARSSSLSESPRLLARPSSPQGAAPPFVAYSASWSASLRRGRGKRRRKRSQAVKPARPLASHPNPPGTTRIPTQATPRKRREAPAVGGRWWCGGWAARGARCSRSPISGGGRPTPGPLSATPSSPPSKCSRTTASSSPSAPPSPPSSRLGLVHQSRIERRLESIESSLKGNHKVEHEEIKKIVTSSNISAPACVATAMTTMVVGYTLGWRGGAWYARRAFRREQQKLMMGHMKSHNRWHWRPFNRLRNKLRNSRLASKNKSTNAHPSVGQSSEAPSTSSSGASADVSSAAQSAVGSA